MGVTYVAKMEAQETVRRKVDNVDVVLDLGPGISPQRFVKRPYVHICVDAHRPYLERVKREVGADPKYVFINARWDQIIGMFPDQSVDSVFALDFIEHLEKEDGLRMLREAERVARRQVVVYTPHGFFPQSYEGDRARKDRWGMDGGYWQTHRSGWQMEDFGEQWEFVISPDFITHNEHNREMEQPMGALWAIRTLSAGTQRRYHVIEDLLTWAFFKETLERGLPPVAFNGLRSAWGAVRRVTGRG